MQVWRGLLLLSLLAAVCLAQRGPRRFIPDQPLEESLAVDNHRLRSGSRIEAEVATRRGVGRRETVQTEDDPSQTLSRARGRTGGRQRQFHSRNSEVSSQESSEYPSRESRKLTSRDESQSERIRPRGRDQASGSRARNAASSREETQGQRFTPRDSSEVTQVSPRRTQHAGSSREETSQRFRSRDSAETTADVNTRQRAGSPREDTQSQRYRIRSKTEETTAPARAVNTGRGRSRTENSADINKSSKRIPSRRVNEEETRPLNPEGSNVRPETRGRSRTLNKDHSLHDQRGSYRSKATSQRIVSKVDSAEDHSGLKHSEAISPPNIEQEKREPLEEEVADNVPNLENPNVKATENIPLPDGAEEKLSEPVQASSNSAEETSPSSPIENALEYPSKLNDVEESYRASRRLDSEIPIQSKSSSRAADESENTRQDARKRVQNLEMSLARGRTSETRGREASSEEQYNNRNIETSNPGRRNGLENSKSPRRFTEPRNRNAANEYIRNRETTHRNESPTAEESVRSDARAKNQHLKDRQRTSEVISRRQQQESESFRGNLETNGRNKNYEGRPRTSTLDDNKEEAKAEGKRLTNRGRLQKPSKTENDELSPRRYSARIPDKSVVPKESTSTSSYSKKSKELSNFRSRAKGKEPTPTAASLESPVELDESVPLSNQVYEKKEEPAVQPADTTTLKSIDKYLSRKPPTSRGRGTAKGPKLVETDSSSEVSDDDNYPEVYKQLKKSGTSPKDILALLKARKAERDKLQNSKVNVIQPDASLNSNRQEIKSNREINSFRARPLPKFQSRNHETDDNLNQNKESNISPKVRFREDKESKSNVKNEESKLEVRSRFQTRSSTPRYQSNYNQKLRNDEVKSSGINEESVEEKPKERKYSSVKRFDYKSLNREKPFTSRTTVGLLEVNEEPNMNLEYESQTEKEVVRPLLISRNKDVKQNVEDISETIEEEISEEAIEKNAYTPRSRKSEYERFKARKQKVNEESTTEQTPIKPNYKLYNRNEGSRRRSFTTPTFEGEDLAIKKEVKNVLVTPRSRPTYVPPKKTFSKKITTPIPLSRYRERKASLTKYVRQEDLKDDDEEDLISRFNGLSIDSLVSESEHATYTTEPSNVAKTTRKRPKYTESFIQRIPPRGRSYTRPTLSTTTTTELTTTLDTSTQESTTEEIRSLNLPELDFSTNGETSTPTVVESFIPSITMSEATTLETTTTTPTTTTTTTNPTTTTKVVTSTTKRTTQHTTHKLTTKKVTTTKRTTTTTSTTTTMPTTTTTRATTTMPTTTTTITTTRPTTTTPTTTTTKPTTTTTKPTTTTTKPTTTTTKPTTTTTKPTTTTTKPTTTTTKPTTTTTKPTTTKPKPINTTTKSTTTTKKPTTTTTKTTTKKTKATTTTTRKPPTTKKLTTTKPLTSSTTESIVTSPHTAVPRKIKATTVSPPTSTTFKLDSLLSTTSPNFLSTVVYLAKNLSVTPIDFEPVNTADFRTTPKPVERTTSMSNSEHYIVYGLLPNKNVVRKVVRTTKAPLDLPFIIYGLYPNGTIVRRFPNGTIIPDETEEENEVIGNVDSGSPEQLENVVKKDSPLSYLYPPGMERPLSTESTISQRIAGSSRTEQPPSTAIPRSSSIPTTTQTPTLTTTKATSMTKKVTQPTTTRPLTTTKKITTTKMPATTTKKPVTTTMTKKQTTTTIKPSTKATSRLTTTTSRSTTTSTTRPTTSTTRKATTSTSRPTTASATTTTKKPSQTTKKQSTTKQAATKPTTKPTLASNTLSTKSGKSTQALATPQTPRTTPNAPPPPKQLSDIEILTNLLSQGSAVTENTDVLANKVIQLAIERAQSSSPSGKEISSTDLQSISSTAAPVVKEDTEENRTGETKNKTGKISVWVLPPDETTTVSNLGNSVSKTDEAILNQLLSTPGAIENLSLSDQLLIADVLSSTAFPQTVTTKKKKKKKPKTTTTPPPPPPVFPVLSYLFGRNRGGGGLFQRGLFRGGGLGGLTSTPQVQESAGGFFQNQNQNESPLSQVEEEPLTSPQDPQQQQGALVNAAINVSRAVSQFMGFVLQGAAQSFQNYLQTRTRALTEALTYPPPH